MHLPLIQAIAHKVKTAEGVRYALVETKRHPKPVVVRECAYTRHYEDAISRGDLQAEDLIQIAFLDLRGASVPANDLALPAFDAFWQNHPELHPFTLNQSMAQEGKLIASRYEVNETLRRLFGPEFPERMDTYKYLKVSQIALQPGRLRGGEIVRSQPLERIGCFQVTALVDIKREDEDGMIWVSPRYWDTVLRAAYRVDRSVTLIKVNTMHQRLTIKGVLQRTPDILWRKLVAERVPQGYDVQMILCGNAIKDSEHIVPGMIYELNESCFTYHSDSSIEAGWWSVISKQLQTRSGWDNAHTIALACTETLETLKKLALYDDETVLRVMGALDGEDQGVSDSVLETDIAVLNRILYHGLPAAHPTNVMQIHRRIQSYIRDHYSKIQVPGFHGMGAKSHLDERGVVLVPQAYYHEHMAKHKSDRCYLYRYPYLGAYGGMYVTIRPFETDTIHVHWQDALQMDGDFDGDDFYLMPSKYALNATVGEKPPRPPKGSKEIIPLTEASLKTAMIGLATAKTGIGHRDNLLSAAYDNYHWHAAMVQRHREVPALVAHHQAHVETWKQNLALLQIYEQQAIEGLKHGTEVVLTEQQVLEMFPLVAGEDGELHHQIEMHAYTRLLGKGNFDSKKTPLASTRRTPGYLERCKQDYRDQHSWHPLHAVFGHLAQIELGTITDLKPYWDCINRQRTTAIAPHLITQRNGYFAHLRKLYGEYAKRVRLWNGGKSGVSFTDQVLDPIRYREDDPYAPQWRAFETLIRQAPQGREEEVERDFYLLLAKVAYDPQPNWELVGDPARGWGRKEGVFTRLRRTGPPRLRRGRYQTVQSWKPDDHTNLIDGIVRRKAKRFTFSYRLTLPRNGALFHHLAPASVAHAILKPVLPVINFDAELAQACRAFVRA